MIIVKTKIIVNLFMASQTKFVLQLPYMYQSVFNKGNSKLTHFVSISSHFLLIYVTRREKCWL